MNMFKRILLDAVLATVIATITVPAFAQESATTAKDVQAIAVDAYI
jgi:hypothetical protein